MKYHLKFAIGNLKKSVFTSALNLIGLASAFAAFIIIMLYVYNEHQFDRYNEHAEDIYRIEVKFPDNDKTSVYLFGPTGQTLVKEFPEIVASATYMPWGKWEEKAFSWENQTGIVQGFEDYAYSDEMLTEIFSFEFINGKKQLPLKEPQSAIVSESFAQKAWGDSDPVRKRITTDGQDYTVSAVFADLPQNSVITCPIILTLPSTGYHAQSIKEWKIYNYPQFILVKPGTDEELLNEKINRQSIIKSKHDVYLNEGSSVEIVARPLTDLRFTTEVAETPIFSSNSKLFVVSLQWIGILILLIALINYVNFASANIPKQIKSISITRIIGSGKRDVIAVFLLETFLLFTAAFLIALIASYLINKELSEELFGYILPYVEYANLLGLTGLLILIPGMLAGIYPALYSISGNPMVLLKKLNRNRGISYRGVLTVFQFVATIALIIASITVVKQVQFMEDTDLGFSKDKTVVVRLNNAIKENIEVFKDRLNTSSYFSDYAFSRAVPGQAQEQNSFTVEGKKCPVWYWATDARYIQMMNFELIEGRHFIENSEAEEENLICNETAARRYGWKVGQKIHNGTLVGIIKDFNYVSLRESVEPFTFWYSTSMHPLQCVSIKLNTSQVRDALAYLEKTYNELSPEIPFRYYFMDDRMNELYSREDRQVKMITGFGFLSVIVSILGILGLSTFMCQQKIKEIGVRKVNGATIAEILTMLNKDFVKWVILAFGIAIPIAYYAMDNWLQNFAYKTNLSWWIFASAGLLALCIALLTVS
ncbi:MAG: ABC transporter permease, partial [Bacteroidota bacterium]